MTFRVRPIKTCQSWACLHLFGLCYTLSTLLGIHQVTVLLLVGLTQWHIIALIAAVLTQEAQVHHGESGNVQRSEGALTALTQVPLLCVPALSHLLHSFIHSFMEIAC